MPRLVILLVALVVALATPAAAPAQTSPFGPLPVNPNAPAQAPTPTPSATPDNGSLSDTGRTTLYLIGAALLVAFVAIGVWIARDARRALPERRREPVTAGPARRRPDVKQRARARTKAQRRARRHNRPG